MKKEFCKKYNLTIAQFEGREIINKNLNIKSSIPGGFKPLVKGNLKINASKLPDRFKCIVKGNAEFPNLSKIDVRTHILVIGKLKAVNLTEVRTAPFALILVHPNPTWDTKYKKIKPNLWLYTGNKVPNWEIFTNTNLSAW